MLTHFKSSHWLSGIMAAILLSACTGTDSSSSRPQTQSSSKATVDPSDSSSSTPALSSASVSSVRVSSAAVSSSFSSAHTSGAAACNTFAPVLAAFKQSNCILCHGATAFNNLGGGLNLESGNVGKRLLERKTANTAAACQDDVLINQAKPNRSLLLKLINNNKYTNLAATGCNRNPMPFAAKSDASQFMPAAAYACVASWVSHVAATQTPAEQTPNSSAFMAADAGMALAKAKYILHGAAPTSRELERIGGSEGTFNASALRSLIKQWEQTPQYETKMRSFLKATLQQRSIGDRQYVNQLSRIVGGGAPLDADAMRQNLDESFIHTAWDIVNTDQDFRAVISTRSWRVTTALLAAYVWMDKPKHPQGKFFRNLEHLKPEDFRDWRTVHLTQADEAAEYTNTAGFTSNLRNIPDGGTLALQFPRVGFFSAPVFLKSWQTNDDNQFRVTLNQTLIVALGKTFEPSDATAHISDNGIPQEHAVKGSVCYECHRHMDPMRLVFLNSMNTRYRATTPDNRLKPSFSFYGVTQDFTTMDQFATLLRDHPQMPINWVQKVCVWGNSQRCDEADPEFKRLVNVFTESNYALRVLFRHFFSSPLFTQVSQTRTFEQQDGLVSMSRGEHFCNAMAARVEQINTITGRTQSLRICSNDQLGVVPQDLYSRGEVDLIQASRMILFDAKSIDSECSRVAGDAIKKIFDANAPVAENLEYMVEYVMGIPNNHHRYSATLAGLRRIYDLSNQPNNCADPLNQGSEITCGFGSNKQHSLRAAWFAACTSPELIGVGI
ncbi:hypothetical protein [Marinagarivorans algicola]|uniref:hypothetical protein n=1 Tax=Marinagarivorans algicola TaxID=1513270 RepID=UPI003735C81C